MFQTEEVTRSADPQAGEGSLLIRPYFQGLQPYDSNCTMAQ